MKKNTLFALLCFISIGAFAQGSLEKGKLQLNAGVGTSGWGPLVYAGVDFGITKDISAGAELSYRSDNDYYGSEKYRSSAIGVGINANYHFNRLLKLPSPWDVYAGAGASYYAWRYNHDFYGREDRDNFGPGAQVGARYFFTKQFGVNAELSGGTVVDQAKVGITYKF